MPKESGRNVLRALSLLATGLLLGAVLLAASSQSTSGVQQEIIQTAAWRFTSRLQTFLALHALFLAVLGMLFGIVSALWGSRFGVLWFPIGVLEYLCYALLEPRYSPSTNSFLVEICLHFLIGVSAFWLKFVFTF